MKKLLLLFVLFCGLSFAQHPITVFGDLSMGTNVGEGIGVGVQVTDIVNWSTELSRGPGAVGVTTGFSRQILTINNKYSLSVGADAGFGRSNGVTQFAHEYSVGLGIPVRERYSFGPYLKNSRVAGRGTWVGGITLAVRVK